MELLEAIRKRQSIRKFLSQPIPRRTLQEILLAGQKSPSGMNSQPWEFLVVSGKVLEGIKQDCAAAFRSGQPPAPEFEAGGWPKESRYRRNQVELAKQLFQAMGIAHEDKEARHAWAERGYRLFDAPAAIFLCLDRSLPESSPLPDIGAVMQTICLAALRHDLGTCIGVQGVSYPEVIRSHTGLSGEKRLILSIAIGYPDWEFPANHVITPREDLEAIASFIDVPEQ